jgi:gluconate 2-dehydrogenase gamma chain
MSLQPTLNRRDLLKRVAYLMGGAISTPAMLGLLQGCSSKKQSSEWTPSFLSTAQGAIVAEIAEIMIPRTDTPGAKDVGVPAFIDTILKDAYPKKDQDRYLTGLQQFEQRSREAHGKPFVELEPQQQLALVREFHDVAVQDAEDRELDDDHARENRPFILMTKELTMLGFFTSEVGATQVLQYSAVPGPYRGCVPLAQAGNGKTWAMETSQAF